MTKKRLIITALVISTIGGTGYAWAQSHLGSKDHSAMMGHSAATTNEPSSVPVSEPGQGAFAAIAEIVAKLESNTETNWDIVNISGLREHLRDMDVVTIDAMEVAKKIDGGMQFTVTGSTDVAPSIRRMTLAHAAVMGGINGWQYTARNIDGGAMITVIVPPQDKAKIKALGFFGMMASGSHHQAHHWMMASGQNPHR
jgi:hypothetical protein